MLGNDEIEVFFKLYILLYADDTLILAESREELQAALYAMYLFCNSWDLEVYPSKTMFSVLRTSQKLQLPIDLQLQLCDSMIVPILLYGSEVTGFENSDILEMLCTQFYKIILNVKQSTPNCILYGELGRYPISIQIKSRMIGFWQRIVNGKQDKIAHRLYIILLAMHEGDNFYSKWL